MSVWEQVHATLPLIIAGFLNADIRIPASDGFALRATYSAGRAGGGAVLMLHQCDREGMATGLEPLETALAGAGIASLSLDYRGYGGSVTGKTQDEDARHRGSDIAAAYRVLRERSGAKNIAVVGASCGCRRAGALAAEHPAEVKAMVCLSGSVGRPNPDPPFEQISQLPVLAIGSGSGSALGGSDAGRLQPVAPPGEPVRALQRRIARRAAAERRPRFGAGDRGVAGGAASLASLRDPDRVQFAPCDSHFDFF